MSDERSPREKAVLKLSAGEYTQAGEKYVVSARDSLSGGGMVNETAYEGRERSHTGRALADFARAAVCHRIAGEDGRAGCTVREGVAVAEELRGYVLSEAVERAACDEFIGDLRAVVGNESSKEAYDRARQGYSGVEDGASETGRPFLQAGTELLAHLSRPDDVGWDEIHGSGAGDALGHRIRTKKAQTESFAEDRVHEGKLHAPRGSTEYNTGRYACPDCGSDDINHIAGTKLCLRCSSKTQKK